MHTREHDAVARIDQLGLQPLQLRKTFGFRDDEIPGARLARKRGPPIVDAEARRIQSPHDDVPAAASRDRKSTRLNSSHMSISYAVFCLKKKKTTTQPS